MLLLHLLFWDISILYSEEPFIVQWLMSNIQEDMCSLQYIVIHYGGIHKVVVSLCLSEYLLMFTDIA